jgi:hypothetical protein
VIEHALQDQWPLACGSAPRIDPYRHPSATRCPSPPLLRYGRVGAMDCSTAPLAEPDLRARIRLFGSIDHSASQSWADACGVLRSSQRILSEISRPANQDGG